MANKRVVDASGVEWDDIVDVVVVGAGAAGFPAALTAASRERSVMLVEKGERTGGTMRKSGAWHWIPNNRLMREAGQLDDRDAFLRYAARLTEPLRYDQTAARLGLGEWEWQMFNVFYDRAAEAVDHLAGIGALKPVYSPEIPDYQSHLEAPELRYGRTLQVEAFAGNGIGSGYAMAEQYEEACRRMRIPVLCGHRVVAVAVDSGSVVGVLARSPAGERWIGARQAVIFCSGGFTHSEELRRAFLAPHIVGGCSALTNEGDFVHLATALGLPLRNMQCAWNTPVPFEVAVTRDPAMSGMFTVAGDSMLWVDRHGRRVVNEKATYNELGRAFGAWDASAGENPRFLMTMVWDEAAMQRASGASSGGVLESLRRPAASAEGAGQTPTEPSRSAPSGGGRELPGNDGNVVFDGPHLIRGDDLSSLTSALRVRLRSLAPLTGGYDLAPEFEQNLKASIERFNCAARAGRDADFSRGENPIEVIFHGELPAAARGSNPTMFPLETDGPLYAAFISAGVLDTKGGVITDASARVLDADGTPVDGLYAAGNCAAVASGHAYWAGGATIGPAMTFGYLAALDAAARPVRSLPGDPPQQERRRHFTGPAGRDAAGAGGQ